MAIAARIVGHVKFLWKIERACQKHITDDVLKLGKLGRVFHPKVKKNWIGIGIGVSVAGIGSTIALMGHDQHFVPPAMWDTGAYLIHGFGSIPVLKHGEVIWKAFKAVE